MSSRISDVVKLLRVLDIRRFEAAVAIVRSTVCHILSCSRVYDSAEMYMTAIDQLVSGPVTETRGALSKITIVSSHKGVAVGTPLLPIDPLLCLLERNVHVPINGLQFA